MRGAPELEAIDPSEISVVVQGPLFLNRVEGVSRCLESLRAVLPGAEMIVSTWIDEDASSIGPPVRVVQSTDPGAFSVKNGPPYNLNRLQRSTLAGLALASRTCCLKLRTDLALSDRRFLVLAGRRPGSLFERPMTMSNIYIRDPEKFPLLFHVSDIAQFGLTADLLSFWSGKLFLENEVLFPPESAGQHPVMRLFPEQATTLRWLKRNGIDVALKRPAEIDRKLLELWGRVLVQNFHIIDWRRTGIIFPERFSSDPSSFTTLLTEEKAAALSARGFNYRRARVNAFILGVLLDGKLAALIASLRVRSPLLNHALRWLWSSYHRLTR